MTIHEELKERHERGVVLMKIARQIVELSARHDLSIKEFYGVLDIAKEASLNQKIVYGSDSTDTSISKGFSIHL